jgi:hypothetical protein
MSSGKQMDSHTMALIAICLGVFVIAFQAGRML